MLMLFYQNTLYFPIRPILHSVNISWKPWISILPYAVLNHYYRAVADFKRKDIPPIINLHILPNGNAENSRMIRQITLGLR